MIFRTRFSERQRVSLEFDPKEGRTKSSFKDECDINNIVNRFKRTGQLPPGRGEPQFSDVSDVPSFMDALHRVAVAEEAFASLPATVRRECDNDPAVFLERLRDPEWVIKHKLGDKYVPAPEGSPEPAKAPQPEARTASPAAHSPEGAKGE